mgnify:CR=1 FL=1
MSLEPEFERYFGALERAGGVDRCWLCRRTPAAVETTGDQAAAAALAPEAEIAPEDSSIIVEELELPEVIELTAEMPVTRSG